MTDSFFRTGSGKFSTLRLAGCMSLLYLPMGIAEHGWRSVRCIAWLMIAAAFFAISFTLEGANPPSSKWRSPGFLAGIFVLSVGAALYLFARVFSH